MRSRQLLKRPADYCQVKKQTSFSRSLRPLQESPPMAELERNLKRPKQTPIIFVSNICKYKNLTICTKFLLTVLICTSQSWYILINNAMTIHKEKLKRESIYIPCSIQFYFGCLHRFDFNKKIYSVMRYEINNVYRAQSILYQQKYIYVCLNQRSIDRSHGYDAIAVALVEQVGLLLPSISAVAYGCLPARH